MHLMEQKIAFPKGLRANKRLGQNFLMDEGVAELESKYGEGRNVLELGSGLGVLTRQLCKTARSVLSVEKDRRLYYMLSESLHCPNLSLVNADFFELGEKQLHGVDIMISNVPYMLSSRIIEWLISRKLEAVLCLQKEFVERMLATVGSRKYSRLSVMSALLLEVESIAEVKAELFYPKPRVDSEIIHIKPLMREISEEDASLIKLLMEHKKKKLRNAVIDSSSQLGISKEQARELADSFSNSEERVFRIAPEDLLLSARRLAKSLRLLK